MNRIWSKAIKRSEWHYTITFSDYLGSSGRIQESKCSSNFAVKGWLSLCCVVLGCWQGLVNKIMHFITSFVVRDKCCVLSLHTAKASWYFMLVFCLFWITKHVLRNKVDLSRFEKRKGKKSCDKLALWPRQTCTIYFHIVNRLDLKLLYVHQWKEKHMLAATLSLTLVLFYFFCL